MSRTLGTPTWIDLGTNDLPTAKAFFEKFLDWDFEDSGPTFGHYNMVRVDGGLVGGAMDTRNIPGQDGQPVPSAFTVYLASDDIDATFAKAVENGAIPIIQPDNVGDAGRFAMIIDPSGAPLGIWQDGDTKGYEFTGQPGTPLWFELMTQDYAKASEFYSTVFGFQLVPMGDELAEDGLPRYATNGAQDQATSGICNATGFIPAEMGSFWRVYLGVESCDPAVAHLQELGGRLLDGPEDTPFGRIATVAEPTGATFQICAASESTRESM